MKATVALTTIVELHVDDSVVAEVMSPGWQASYYNFSARDEALVWLADVLHRFESTERVDGLVGIGRAVVEVIGFDGEVSEVTE